MANNKNWRQKYLGFLIGKGYFYKNPLVIGMIGLLIVGIGFFLIKSGKATFLRDIFIFLGDNIIFTFIGLIILLNIFMLVYNWKFTGLPTNNWVKITCVISILTSITLFLYKDVWKLTSVEKVRIHVKYRAEKDSLVKLEKEEYVSLKASLKSQDKKAEKEIDLLKDRIDSLLEANEDLATRAVAPTSTIADCSASEDKIKSLQSEIKGLKEKLASSKDEEKKDDPVVAKTDTKEKDESEEKPKKKNAKSSGRKLKVWQNYSPPGN